MKNLLMILAPTALAACATTGSTFRSGVGDAFLEHPPYYAGSTAPLGEARVGYMPIAYQRGASQPESFDPDASPGTPMAKLVAEMNQWLDEWAREAAVVRLRPVSGTPPDVRFGCDALPGEDCPERGDSALGRGYQAMKLAVGRPSADWISNANGILMEQGATHAIVITLEIGNYLLRQEGLRGTKVLELGTGHRSTLPWLTSLETPVSVLQYTGALVDASGKAVRIGAEGIIPRRTRLSISAIGAQEILTDEDIERARTTGRDDLPGAPLAWQVALRTLLERLKG